MYPHRLLCSALEHDSADVGDAFVCGMLRCDQLTTAAREATSTPAAAPLSAIKLPAARLAGPLLCAVAGSNSRAALGLLLDELREREPGEPDAMATALTTSNLRGRTPLKCAVARKAVHCVKALLEEVKKLPAADQTKAAFVSGVDGQNLMHLACRRPVHVVPPAAVADTVMLVAEGLPEGARAVVSVPYGKLQRTPLMM